MNSRTAKRIIRSLRWMPVTAVMFSGCTCSGGPGSDPPPTAAVQHVAATATAAPDSTDTKAPPPPTQAPPPEPTAAPAAAAPPAADNERRPLCERYVAALSGRDKEAALLAHPEVKALAGTSFDLVMCGAVASDSDALCSLYAQGGPGMTCRQTATIFHELRKYPKTNAFMFTQLDWEECRKVSWADPKVCDTVRDAVRANDPEKCAPLGDRQSMCRAYVELDPSLCKVPPQAEKGFRDDLKKAGPEVFEKNKGEPPLAEKCRQAIESKKFLAAGLKGLAESGPERERALARAALGQADACAPFAEPVMQTCLKGGGPVPGTPPGSTPAAAPGGQAPGSKQAD